MRNNIEVTLEITADLLLSRPVTFFLAKMLESITHFVVNVYKKLTETQQARKIPEGMTRMCKFVSITLVCDGQR